MGDQVIDLAALYRAPVTVRAEHGAARYTTTLASVDRIVLDAEEPVDDPGVEVGERVSLGCPDLDGWITGEARVVAVRPHGLVTTAPRLTVCQRRSARRVPLSLPVELRLLDEPEVALAGRTTDVSAGGFAAHVAPHHITAGDRLRASFQLPDGPDAVVVAQVVAGGGLVRCRFTDIARRDEERLVTLLSRTELRRGIRR